MRSFYINIYKNLGIYITVFCMVGMTGCESIHPAKVTALKPSNKAAQKKHYYHVQKGESLYQIAKRNNLSLQSLAKTNGISAPYTIYPGQKLALNANNAKAVKTNSKPVQVAALNKQAKSTSKPVKAAKPQPRKTKQTARNNTTLSWGWPQRGPVLQNFGGKDVHNHPNNGINLGGKLGDKVFAAADGEIVYSGDALRGYGNLIIVKHNEKYLSAYAHNQKNLVKEKDKVKKGQVIAQMGKSGTDKVQLHFEVRYQGEPIDPNKVLPSR